MAFDPSVENWDSSTNVRSSTNFDCWEYDPPAYADCLTDSELYCEHGLYSEDCEECEDMDESDTERMYR